jgi:hypothetical protein
MGEAYTSFPFSFTYIRAHAHVEIQIESQNSDSRELFLIILEACTLEEANRTFFYR